MGLRLNPRNRLFTFRFILLSVFVIGLLLASAISAQEAGDDDQTERVGGSIKDLGRRSKVSGNLSLCLSVLSDLEN
ncbi:Treponemal membrane protein A [Bienertia sinuspersici]